MRCCHSVRNHPGTCIADEKITAYRNSYRVFHRLPADGAAAHQTGRNDALLHRGGQLVDKFAESNEEWSKKTSGTPFVAVCASIVSGQCGRPSGLALPSQSEDTTADSPQSQIVSGVARPDRRLPHILVTSSDWYRVARWGTGTGTIYPGTGAGNRHDIPYFPEGVGHGAGSYFQNHVLGYAFPRGFWRTPAPGGRQVPLGAFLQGPRELRRSQRASAVRTPANRP